jgi:hypothetical protein
VATTKSEVKEKAKEPVVLARSELWMLRIAALTGVASLISHGADAAGKLLGLF